MEICEVFEEWDGSEIKGIATVDSLLLEEEESPLRPEVDEADGSDDEDVSNQKRKKSGENNSKLTILAPFSRHFPRRKLPLSSTICKVSP